MDRTVNRLLNVMVAGALAAGAFAFAAYEAPAFAWAEEEPAVQVLENDDLVITNADGKLLAALSAQLDALGIENELDAEESTLTLYSFDAEGVTSLDLSGQGIESVAGLEAFGNLTELDLSHNAITDATPLAALTNLINLNLYDNAVRDITPLASLAHLGVLNLGQNNGRPAGQLDAQGRPAYPEFKGLEALDALNGLITLDFSQNHAPKVIEHLAGMTELEVLNLQQNDLTDVAGLEGLASLKMLVLADNQVAGVTALVGLANLQELYLQNNSLYEPQAAGADGTGLDAAFVAYYPETSDDDTAVQEESAEFEDEDTEGMDDEGEGPSDEADVEQGEEPQGPQPVYQLAWPGLVKLDIWGNDAIVEKAAEGAVHTDILFALDKAGVLELGYSYDQIVGYDELAPVPLSELPHVDSTGAAYVTYDDFGAVRDGVRDDYNAIRNAHRFANDYNCEVWATADAAKPYHIFHTYGADEVVALTNIDWQGATFIIHDGAIASTAAREVPLFTVNARQAVEYQDASWSLGEIIESLADGLSPVLGDLVDQGYGRFFVLLEDAEGNTQQVFVDENGDLEEAVPVEIGALAKATVIPVPTEKGHVRNATFYVVPPVEAAPAAREGKSALMQRNVVLDKCVNLEVSNIVQAVGQEKDGAWVAAPEEAQKLEGYAPFIELRNVTDVEQKDVSTVTAGAAPADEGAADEPAADPAGEPAEEPSTEPADEPSSGDEPAPGTEPSDEPGTEPASEPSDEPGTQPGTEPADEPSEPGTEPSDNTPASGDEPKPADKPSDTEPAKPADEPAKPADSTAPTDPAKPADAAVPAAQPADDSATKPADAAAEPANLDYSIIYNVGSWQSVVAGNANTNGYTITSNAPYDKFVGVSVDGAAVPDSEYTVEPGAGSTAQPTMVTLLSDYLSTLEAGDHEATIESSDGSADATFSVVAAAEEPEATPEPAADQPVGPGSVNNKPESASDATPAAEPAADQAANAEGATDGQPAATDSQATDEALDDSFPVLPVVLIVIAVVALIAAAIGVSRTRRIENQY